MSHRNQPPWPTKAYPSIRTQQNSPLFIAYIVVHAQLSFHPPSKLGLNVTALSGRAGWWTVPMQRAGQDHGPSREELPCPGRWLDSATGGARRSSERSASKRPQARATGS